MVFHVKGTEEEKIYSFNCIISWAKGPIVLFQSSEVCMLVAFGL